MLISYASFSIIPFLCIPVKTNLLCFGPSAFFFRHEGVLLSNHRLLFMPGSSFFHLIQVKTHTLVIGGVQHEESRFKNYIRGAGGEFVAPVSYEAL